MKLEFNVSENCEYKTVKEVLIQEFKFSNRLLTKVTKSHCVYLNNKIIDTRTNIKSGDFITIDLGYPEDNSNIIPTKMNLNIIYEDDWLLILNKPSGIAIHPSCKHFDTSLSNGIKYYFDSIGLQKKIRPVNRLDYDTSGLCIFAKCEYIQEMLSKQFSDTSENKNFIKQYHCLIEGHLKEKSGTICLPIDRKPGSIIEREVNINGQKAITDYVVLKEFDDYSLIECTLKTGRTHQIRVHFSYIGHPLLGDTLYGRPSSIISRQALHSYRIKFIHPITGVIIDLKETMEIV